MSARSLLTLVTAYARARRLDGLRSRRELERIQARWLSDLLSFVSSRSAFYGAYAHAPLMDWPKLNKTLWMEHFDTLNTVGARRSEANEIAAESERTRDFSKRMGQFTVGFSTGTSGNRGLFLASPSECATWAGTLLGRLLRKGLFARERIALVLRAGATLYDAVGVLGLKFQFFDQSRPWDTLISELERFNPTLLVAPASALGLLTATSARLKPRRVISVAEVLDPLDRDRIERHFQVSVEQIYQATEGLLGVSCEVGTVHLNEPYILVEPEWQDEARTRFVPVITDLRRRSQPVIRYRLNDVLVVKNEPCACGRAALPLASIGGRTDDVLWLEGHAGRVPVFPDVLARTIVSALPELEDYRVEEIGPNEWRIGLCPLPVAAEIDRLITSCEAMIRSLGAKPPSLVTTKLSVERPIGKLRRIRGRSPSCVS